MATVKLTEKPEAEGVGSEDKVVLVQGGALRLAGLAALAESMGIKEAETAMAELNSVVGGAE